MSERRGTGMGMLAYKTRIEAQVLHDRISKTNMCEREKDVWASRSSTSIKGWLALLLGSGRTQPMS